MVTTPTTSELTEPRIWSSVIRALQLPLTEHSVDFPQLLHMCGISEDDLVRVDGRVPLKRYLRFMEQASITANDPLLGTRLARSCGPETLGAVGFLFLSSRTLSEAISDFCTYLNLLQDTTDFRSRLSRSELTFYYQMYGVPDVDCRQDVEFSIALTSRLIRMFGGGEMDISHINFRHSPSAPPVEYERILKTEVRFNQESNSVTVPASLAHVGGSALDSSLSGVLKGFLDTELVRLGRIKSFVDQVRRMLLSNRVAAPVTAAKIANHLGVSPATLYRKLKAEGTTFGALQKSVSFEIAKNYLAGSELTITQIAHVVGFSESASFTRAFSRWTNGTTPSQFRRNEH